MLSDLSDLQSSDEDVWHVNMSFDIETRSAESNELVHKTYTFSYQDFFDKWSFREYYEKRTDDTTLTSDRNWKRSRHIIWSDTDVPTIDVPPEVADALAKATGSESVTIEVPRGTITNSENETVKTVDNSTNMTCVGDD